MNSMNPTKPALLSQPMKTMKKTTTITTTTTKTTMKTMIMMMMMILVGFSNFASAWERTCKCPPHTSSMSSSWSATQDGSRTKTSTDTGEPSTLRTDTTRAARIDVLDQRSLCPWEMHLDYDKRRLPSSLVYAKLQTVQYCNNMHRQCMAVTEAVNVTARCTDSSCNVCTEHVPVAFVCAMRPIIDLQ